MAVNNPASRALRRRFILIQAAKAGAGAALGLGFVLAVGWPGPAEWAAIGGFTAPAALAVLGLAPIQLETLEQAGLILFAGLIGYLALLSGGVTSPMMVWLALVPAEAALAGGRSQVTRAGFAAAAALLVVAGIQAADLLPPSRLTLPLWQVYAISGLTALMQAVLVAIAAQDRRRTADLAAAEGAAMYRFLAENAMDLITRHAPDGSIRYASPSALSLLGRPPSELEGRSPPVLVHPGDLAVLKAAFTNAACFGRAGSVEIRLRRCDQSYVWTEMRCRPAEGAAPADIVAVTRDISERKAHESALIEARDAAESASRAKSAFLANMSHELRTPLNAILGFSEVMTQQMFGPVGSARYQEYAKLIHESGGHLLELINSVLDMSKIEAGKFDLHEEVFDLTYEASSAIRFVAQAADRAGVKLHLSLEPGTERIFADRRAVKQILINLINNGVKFTPRGGEVRVDARRERGGIMLSVADTGTGIAQKDLDRLGKPFEQVESAQTRAKEGTGLGLALVRSLAALHGGEMTLESALGVGTIVRVRLPSAAVAGDGTRLESTEILPFRGAA